ncbi:MAG: phosphoethanolamine transferase domain-containing protein [Burkholderiaceae bacterium]|jgi:glucan phosphoethanolaminetransferase (alkaline phosphatase superfamily)|nr:phosphoethanolamine transferase domain-containing protein [Burkholderiaceae bacterium]
MSLRLFHITEFADSMLTPAAQREARHPALLLLLASLWLALAGNFPLWRELSRLPLDGGSFVWIALCFALLTTAALGLLLSLLNWPWLLKGVITLLLWLAAFNTALLWAGHAYLSTSLVPQGLHTVLAQLRSLPIWQLLLVLGVLALAPSIWLWQLRLRRVALPTRLPQNLLLALLCACMLAAVWFAGRGTLLPLLQDQPRWLELLSPFNTLLSLRHA